MKNYSIDIHAHCSLKPYNHNYPGDPMSLWKSWSEGDLGCDIQSEHILGLFIKKILRTTQTTLQQAAEGNVKIVGLSMMTFEGGWTGKRISGVRKSLLSCLTGISKQKLKVINKITRQKEADEIYNDTVSEFKYILQELQKKHTDSNGTDWNFEFLTRDTLKKIKDGTIDLDSQNTVYILLNIEGLQTLGIASMLEGEHQAPLLGSHVEKIRKRINNIKDTWPAIPQYITLCHHFGNGIAGHAPSIPGILGFAGVNQDNFIYKGLQASGKKIITTMLGDTSRPILVDIKHLSPLARRDFYKFLENDIKDQFGKKYPIICSHTGIIDDMETLSELIACKGNEKKLNKGYLHNTPINMCKEDLQHISDSGGMIGIQIDLKRLAGREYLNLLKRTTTYDATNQPVEDIEAQKRLSREIVWANIFAAVGLLNKKSAWKLLCIGSDYDGIVSFLPGYPTMSEYKYLKSDMQTALEQMSFQAIERIVINGKALDNSEIERLMFGYSAEELTDMVFSTNAVDFWSKHYTDQTRPASALISG